MRRIPPTRPRDNLGLTSKICGAGSSPEKGNSKRTNGLKQPTPFHESASYQENLFTTEIGRKGSNFTIYITLAPHPEGRNEFQLSIFRREKWKAPPTNLTTPMLARLNIRALFAWSSTVRLFAILHPPIRLNY